MSQPPKDDKQGLHKTFFDNSLIACNTLFACAIATKLRVSSIVYSKSLKKDKGKESPAYTLSIVLRSHDNDWSTSRPSGVA